MSVEYKEKISPEIEGVIFLVCKEGNVLLEERIDPNKAYFGLKIIPGGHVDYLMDKNHEDARDREVFEECGVVVKGSVLLDTFYNVTAAKKLCFTSAYLVTDYEGEVQDKEPEKSKHIWVRIQEAKKLLPFVESRYILDLATKKLTEKGLLKDSGETHPA